MKLYYRFFIVIILIAGMGGYLHLHSDLEVPLAKPFGDFPPLHHGWQMTGQSSLSENVMKVLMPTDYLARRYVSSDGAVVDMYLSYFDGGPNSGRIHSPKHCVVGAGWTELLSQPITFDVGGASLNLVRAIYANGSEREVIYYWFAMRGITMSDEYSLKLAEITGSMFYHRRDQSFIRISVRTHDSGDKEQKDIEKFIRDFYPLMQEYIPS